MMRWLLVEDARFVVFRSIDVMNDDSLGSVLAQTESTNAPPYSVEGVVVKKVTPCNDEFASC